MQMLNSQEIWQLTENNMTSTEFYINQCHLIQNLIISFKQDTIVASVGLWPNTTFWDPWTDGFTTKSGLSISASFSHTCFVSFSSWFRSESKTSAECKHVESTTRVQTFYYLLNIETPAGLQLIHASKYSYQFYLMLPMRSLGLSRALSHINESRR